MSITRESPRTIMLAANAFPPVIVNDRVASEAITPGMLVEMISSGSDQKWRKNASATEQVEIAVALNQPELNLGVDDAYAAGDLVNVWKPGVGDVFWGLIQSGEDIAEGDLLQSASGGYVKEATATTASANLAKFKALSSPGAVTADTRVVVERIQ